MELKQLEFFLAVCQTRQISAAASQLYVTQPAITMSIRRLEKELGARLYYFSRNELKLTPAGEMLYKCAEKVILTTKQFQRDLSMLNEDTTGILEIHIPGIACAGIYPLLYNDFVKAFPTISLRVKDALSPEVVNSVLSGETELGFCIEPKDRLFPLEFKKYVKCEMALLVPDGSALAKKDEVYLSDLMSERILFCYRGQEITFIERLITDLFRQNGIKMPAPMYIEDNHILTKLVSTGLGIYPFANSAAKPFDNIENTTVKPLKGMESFWAGLVYSKERPLSSPAQAFVDWFSRLPVSR